MPKITNWKKGRGKLGIFLPLLGEWECNKGSKDFRNPEVTRTFSQPIGQQYIVQDVVWHMGEKTYTDHTIIGLDREGNISCWSFTSDGKNSTGDLTDVTDVHPDAFGFESQMPAGIARQVFWPDDEDGFRWAVESKTKKGWNRFVEQHYRRKG